MEQYDVVIIGAGLYGIAAARSYLEVHPDSKLIILEGESVIGGAWSDERVYDEFWTQTPLGMAEFSDSPLRLPQEVKTDHGFFPAKYVTRYLNEYINMHVYRGKSLRDRILFRHKVISARRSASGEWEILCNDSTTAFVASKLIVASGLTTTPHEPTIPNSALFSGEILHQKAFGQTSFLSDPLVTNVAVLGGGKSAADIVYAAAKAGIRVTWIVRKSGSGPATHIKAESQGPYENPVAMFGTRIILSLTPSIFDSDSMSAHLLHRTKVGRKIVDWIWANIDRLNRAAAGYQSRKGEGSGFEKLEPDCPLFWQSPGSGIAQKPDFWQMVADRADVHRADIMSFNSKTIELSDNSTIPADVLVCATGWEPSLAFLSAEDRVRLGLPVRLSEEPPLHALRWRKIDASAQEQVVHLFPKLKDKPDSHAQETTTSPYRLYRSIAPISQNETILFLGYVQVGNNFMVAEAQALWAVAYLDRRLNLPAVSEMEKGVAETVMWCRLRYPEKGWDGTFYYFDVVSYVDTLLRDVGLKSHWRPWPIGHVAPVRAKNLGALMQEYLLMR